jgi:Ras-related protein Rab-5C
MDKKFTYKIVIIGDSTVGKTSLITRYIKDIFDDLPENCRTVNAYNLEKIILINENSVKLNIWVKLF